MADFTRKQILDGLRRIDRFFSHPNKWRKDGAGDGKTRCCLLIGAYHATGSLTLNERISNEFRRTLGFHAGESLAEWNDGPPIKFKDVKKLIRDTIKRIRSQSPKNTEANS